MAAKNYDLKKNILNMKYYEGNEVIFELSLSGPFNVTEKHHSPFITNLKIITSDNIKNVITENLPITITKNYSTVTIRFAVIVTDEENNKDFFTVKLKQIISANITGVVYSDSFILRSESKKVKTNEFNNALNNRLKAINLALQLILKNDSDIENIKVRIQESLKDAINIVTTFDPRENKDLNKRKGNKTLRNINPDSSSKYQSPRKINVTSTKPTNNSAPLDSIGAKKQLNTGYYNNIRNKGDEFSTEIQTKNNTPIKELRIPNKSKDIEASTNINQEDKPDTIQPVPITAWTIENTNNQTENNDNVENNNEEQNSDDDVDLESEEIIQQP